MIRSDSTDPNVGPYDPGNSSTRGTRILRRANLAQPASGLGKLSPCLRRDLAEAIG